MVVTTRLLVAGLLGGSKRTRNFGELWPIGLRCLVFTVKCSSWPLITGPYMALLEGPVWLKPRTMPTRVACR